MDVPEIKPGGVDHRERPVEIARPDPRGDKRSARLQDSATISHDGRHTLKTIDRFVDQLRGPESDRATKVDEARARLASGELDSGEVFRAVADRILRGGDKY